METLKKLLSLLEERLEQHDENRKKAQRELQGACSKINEDADSLEEKISEKISEDFSAKEEEILGLIEKINKGEGDMNAFIEQAHDALSKEWRYEIQHSSSAGKSFVGSYELRVSLAEAKKDFIFDNTESITKELQKHLDDVHDSMNAAQEKLGEICDERRKEAEKLEEKINGKLEGFFEEEDARIQSVVKIVKENIGSENPEEVRKLTRKAQLTLLKNQEYSLSEGGDSFDSYDLKVEKKASLEVIEFEERKPNNLFPSFTKKGELSLFFTFFDEDEEEVLKDVDLSFEVEVKMWEKGHEEDNSRPLTKEFIFGSDETVFLREIFTASTTYCLRMRIVHQEMNTQWSENAEVTTLEFKDCCVWKECPDDVNEKMKYSVDEKNPRIATKINGHDRCTVIGNTALPLNTVTSWSIKILNSFSGMSIYVGVAPSDIDQKKEDNLRNYGWHFYCYGSALFSGPPHNYEAKNYGLKKGDGYAKNNVGVVMDTEKGELSFVVDGVNHGVAYEGIPLDKPLVPCVLIDHKDDFVELDTSKAKENVDSSLDISNTTAKNTTWDSITLTWDAVEGVSFYQIEVDGSKSLETSTTNSFTKWKLLPETEHTFRVRSMKERSVGKWSDVVKARTLKAPIDFEMCAWKECPGYVYKSKRYSIDGENPRIATKVGDNGYYCAIIGDTPLPLSTVVSWSIKILKSKKNDGKDFCIGVGPSDINQDEGNNYKKCGWYFQCYDSTLWSGPPHNYSWKEYGSKKGKGKHVRTGDSIGVIMDTSKGELSFVVNKVNLGVAYEGIPLDKPLVPCVLLQYKDDSAEIDTNKVKEKDNCIIS